MRTNCLNAAGLLENVRMLHVILQTHATERIQMNMKFLSFWLLPYTACHSAFAAEKRADEATADRFTYKPPGSRTTTSMFSGFCGES